MCLAYVLSVALDQGSSSDLVTSLKKKARGAAKQD